MLKTGMRQNSSGQQLTTTQLISTYNHRDKLHQYYDRTHLSRIVMRALVMQPFTRVARARARGTRCWLDRGDSSPRQSPRALHIRARAAGFLARVTLSAGPLTLPAFSASLSLRLCWPSI